MGDQTQLRAGRLLLSSATRLQRLQTSRLAQLPAPLTIRQYRTLRRIQDGLGSATAISRQSNISIASVSESIDALSRRGLIARKHDLSDRRTYNLELSDAGRKAVAAAEDCLDQLAEQLTSMLDREQLTVLMAALQEVSQRIQDAHAAMAGPEGVKLGPQPGTMVANGQQATHD